MNLPKKLPVFQESFDSKSSAQIIETVNAIIDYLAKHEPKKRSIWNLEVGDKYFYLGTDGTIEEQRFDDVSIDLDWREHGGMFLTREEAEAERERRQEMAKGM